MFYRYSLSIPRSTPKNAPVSLPFKLPAGVIHRIIVKFPPGCHQHVYFAIFQGANKQFPTGPAEWFQGDGENIDFKEHVVTKHGFHWNIKGYSPDTNFPHRITVRIGVLREEDVTPLSLVKDLVSVFKRMLGVR